MHGERGACRAAVGVGREDEYLVFHVRDQRSALRNGGKQQRGLADRDRFPARLGVGGRVGHGRLDQRPRRALRERLPGKVAGQPQVEVVNPVRIGFSGVRCRFRHFDIGARYLQLDLRMIDRLAKEVIRAHRAGHMIAGAVIPAGFAVLFREVDGHLELREHVALHVERDFDGVRRRFRVVHQRAEVVRPQIDLVGQREFRGSDAEFVGLGGLAEDLVGARIFNLKGQRTVAIGFEVGAVQRQGAHMDRLARLIDGLFGGKQNLRLLANLDGLAVLRAADRRVGDEAQLVVAGETGGKAETCLECAAMVEAAGKKLPGGLFFVGGVGELDAQLAIERRIVVGVGHDDANGCAAAGEILALAQNPDHGPPQNLRDRLDSLNRVAFAV